jgi:putative MATE family efflux protein
MKKNINKMMSDKPFRMILFLGIPSVVMALLDEINSTIDTIFLGQFIAPEAVSAMSVAVPFLILVSAIAFLFADGAGIAIARYIGAEKIDNAKKIFNSTIFISVLSSVVIGLISFMFMPNILSVFNLTGKTLEYSGLYLKVIAICMPVVVLTMVLSKMIYTEGHTKFLVKVTLIQITSNIVMNYIALGILKIGIMGAGIATVLSYALQSCIIIRFINSNKMIIKIDKNLFRVNKAYFKEIIPLGLATFVTMLFLSFTLGLESRIIASFGDNPLAVQTITGNVFSITSSVASGIMSAVLVLMSYSVGAKNKKRFMEIFKISCIIVFSATIIINLPIIIFPTSIARIFTDSEELIALFVLPATIYAASSPVIFTTNTVLYAMQPIGMEKTSTVIFALQQILFFIPLLFILKPFGFNYAILAQPSAELIGAVLTLFIIPIFIRKVKNVFKHGITNMQD